MTKTDEVLKAILPCPFCGTIGEIMEGHRNHWRVECPKCGVRRAQFANGGVEEDKARAVKHWNRRASIQPADDAVERNRQAFALNHALIVVGQSKSWEWDINDIAKMLDAMQDYAALASPQGEKGE